MRHRSDYEEESNNKQVGQDYQLPSQKQLMNPSGHKDLPDPFYRTGRQKSRTNKIGINAMALQEKLMGCGRIMPKQHTQDKEWLYSENLKFKEKIRQLAEQNTRFKTRVAILEKEKDQLFIQADLLANSTDLRPLTKGNLRNKSHHQSSKNSISINPQNVAARRMFRDAKEEIEKLKNENNKIKKSIKYSQLSQMQIENDNLLQETVRLEKYIQEISNQDNYHQYQQAIDDLKRKLIQQKEATRSFPSQMKKKDDEIEQLKQKLKDLQNKKNQNEKRLNREISILKGEVTTLKKSNTQMKQIKDKPNIIIKPRACQQCAKHNDDKRLMDKRINNLQRQLRQNRNKTSHQPRNNKSKGSVEFQRSFQKTQDQKALPTKKTVTSGSPKKQSAKEPAKIIIQDRVSDINQVSESKEYSAQQKLLKPNNKEQNITKNDIQGHETRNQNLLQQKKPEKVNQHKKQDLMKQQQQKKLKSQPVQDNYGVDQFEQEKLQNNKVKKENDEEDLYNDEFNEEDFRQPENESKPKTSQQARSKISKKKSVQDYQQDFDNNVRQNSDLSEEQQVLFQKQPQPNKKKDKKQKVNKVLKQTITYKFMAQRYTYQDFQEDLKNSGISTFTVEDIAAMLANEPFFLTDEQQEFMVFHCFSRSDIQATDVLPIKTFLKKMKVYIGQANLIEKEQQQVLLKEAAEAILGQQESIIKKCLKNESEPGLINKKTFIKILNQIKLTDQRQQAYCLSQIAVCSPDIQHLNYIDFFEKFGKEINRQ